MSAEMMANFMSQADVQALKDYVRGPSGQEAGRADSTVLLQVTHSNLKARFLEIRFDRHMTVGRVKEKLKNHCGTAVSAMRLQLKDPRGQLLCALAEEARPLGFYSPQDGFILHVVDTDPTSASANGWLEDVSKVKKYEISEEAYDQRENTYRKFKAEKLKEDPTWTLQKEIAMKKGLEYKPPVSDPDHMKAEAEGVAVGQRCEVFPGGKRGEVMFVGRAEGLPEGFWVGVKLDEPVGKNNGTVKGKQYFQCLDNYGTFVRPDKVTCGDFPPLDDFDFSDEEI
mmetsp:Transcript_18317/g.51694  ORF Transcript_18317/g.51694 Transcript_18317/m.51694 type:complete len:283 (+) Transcript_18317:15-863(+)